MFPSMRSRKDSILSPFSFLIFGRLCLKINNFTWITKLIITVNSMRMLNEVFFLNLVFKRADGILPRQ